MSIMDGGMLASGNEESQFVMKDKDVSCMYQTRKET